MTPVHQPQVAMALAIAHPIVQNWEELLQEHVHLDSVFVVYVSSSQILIINLQQFQLFRIAHFFI